MEKFRLLYIMSLVILGVLLVYTAITVTQHISPSEKSAVLVEKQELIEPGGKAVVKFKIINRKDRDQLYTYRILVDGSEVYRREVVVPANASYLRPWHFYPTGEGRKEVQILIYEARRLSEPIENITYYIFVKEKEE